ncbi:MAG TPA: M23 family metallopeptidase [Candidatus Gracilibacteria bacterium]
MVLKKINFPLWYEQVLHSPFGLQCIVLSCFIGFLMGFEPLQFYGARLFQQEYELSQSWFLPLAEQGFIKNNVGVDTSGLREVFEEDENGVLVHKIVPQKRNKEVTYNAKPGDNISKIAHKFGLKVSTLLWANRLTSKETISVGQEIIVPPTDGIYYKVQAQDTLSEIAKSYGIELAKIQAYNVIQNDVIKPGQSIFLPEAKKIYIAPRTYVTNTTSSDRTQTISSVQGFRIMRPAVGVLTQGYHGGHFALDIANSLNTPIYASAPGKVIKASDGGWNYGYGRHVIIDHGNNIQTMYAHNNLIKVEEGQEVKAGELIALMGNTGRVFGPTGIHLHFELRINGKKVNPSYYFK